MRGAAQYAANLEDHLLIIHGMQDQVVPFKTTVALAEEPGGVLQELILISEQHQLLFRQIDDEYSLVMAIALTGSLGKARYLVRSLLQELREEL